MRDPGHSNIRAEETVIVLQSNNSSSIDYNKKRLIENRVWSTQTLCSARLSLPNWSVCTGRAMTRDGRPSPVALGLSLNQTMPPNVVLRPVQLSSPKISVRLSRLRPMGTQDIWGGQ